MSLPAAGEIVGGFRLGTPLGQGGMGTVWSARSADGVDAAVKCVAVAGEDERALARAEVRAIAALDHPSIARVYDLGEEPGFVWLAMERGLGTALHCSLDRRVEQILGALAHAHARGVIHRDVKPANIVQQPGDHVMLVDFGISTRRREHDAIPSAGSVPFMAPEQIRAQPEAQGPWTDLYAMGCTVWAWITGQSPFLDAMEHLSAELPSADVPEPIRAWVAALTEKNPYRRPRSAAHALALWRAVEVDVGATATVEPTLLTVTRVEARRFDIEQPLKQWEHETVDLPRTPPDDGALSLDRRHLDGGLALVALREPRFRGRREAREQLWELLRASVDRPIAAWIRGAPSTGRTRGLKWLARHAAEHGAVALEARTPGELVCAALRTPDGSKGTAIRAAAWRLELPTRDIPTLEAVVDGGTPGGWLGATTRLLAAVGLPLVVAVDEPDPHSPLLRLIAELADRQIPSLALAAGADPPEGWSGAVVELPALSKESLRAVASDLLFLDPGTRAALAEEASTVGALVARVRQLAAKERLRPSPRGFRLLDRATSLPPTELLAVPDPRPLADRVHDALARDDVPAALALARTWLDQAPTEDLVAHRRYRELLEVLVLGDELDALEELALAAESSADPDRAMEARLAQGRALHISDMGGALHACRRAAEHATTPAARARRDLAEALLLFYAQHDPESAALADGVDLELLDPSDTVAWLRLRGQRASIEGEPEQATERLRAALSLAREHQMPARIEIPLLATLAVFAYLADDLDTAEQMYLDAIHRSGGPESPGSAQTTMNLAYLWLKRGQWDQARALLDVLLPITRRSGLKRPLAYALIARWSIAERSEDAAAWFAEGFAAVQELGLEDGDFDGLARKVEARWARDDPARANEARTFLAWLART